MSTEGVNPSGLTKEQEDALRERFFQHNYEEMERSDSTLGRVRRYTDKDLPDGLRNDPSDYGDFGE